MHSGIIALLVLILIAIIATSSRTGCAIVFAFAISLVGLLLFFSPA